MSINANNYFFIYEVMRNVVYAKYFLCKIALYLKL